ncbi:MAG TPA: epoxyqueuosine reductase [Verrucomicrobiae bacterium]|nr:epoxyqueuosine reductase [Verrucomicrobiae bacterium]
MIKQIIEQKIHTMAQNPEGNTRYRTPLIAYLPAGHPNLKRLKEVAHAGHLGPEDILPGAKSVVAFFLPFAAEIVEANKRGEGVAREWAAAYVETNRLIGTICSSIQAELSSHGVRAAFAKATHNFDEVELVSFWSHKHIAWAAGLGKFGINQLLITPAGCAGRFGSLVLDVELQTDLGPEACAGHGLTFDDGSYPEFTYGCLIKTGKKCGKCIEYCPSGALTEAGLDKQKCYGHLLKVSENFTDLGLCDVCGKCVVGPCALRGF